MDMTVQQAERFAQDIENWKSAYVKDSRSHWRTIRWSHSGSSSLCFYWSLEEVLLQRGLGRSQMKFSSVRQMQASSHFPNLWLGWLTMCLACLHVFDMLVFVWHDGMCLTCWYVYDMLVCGWVISELTTLWRYAFWKKMLYQVRMS